MLQDFFWKNSDHNFFELGNYYEQQKKNTEQPLNNLHMIDGLGDETQITSFDMFCTSSPRSKSLSLNILSKYCPSVCASIRLPPTNKRRVCICLWQSVISMEL
jgi:hypothetical protein